QVGLVEEGELVAEAGLGAFGAVGDEPAALVDGMDVGLEVGEGVGDDGPDADEVLVSAELLGVDVADQVVVGWGGPFGVALDAGHAANQSSSFDIAQQGPPGGRPQEPGGGANRGRVGGGVDPLVVGGPGAGAGGFGPQREAVVEQMVVQVDQPRVEQPAAVDGGGGLEPGRFGVLGGDGGDGPGGGGGEPPWAR